MPVVLKPRLFSPQWTAERRERNGRQWRLLGKIAAFGLAAFAVASLFAILVGTYDDKRVAQFKREHPESYPQGAPQQAKSADQKKGGVEEQATQPPPEHPDESATPSIALEQKSDGLVTVPCPNDLAVEAMTKAQDWTRDAIAPAVPDFGFWDPATATFCTRYGALFLRLGFTEFDGNIHQTTSCFLTVDHKKYRCQIANR